MGVLRAWFIMCEIDVGKSNIFATAEENQV